MFWVGHTSSKATVRYSSIHNEDPKGGVFVSPIFRGRSSTMERRPILEPRAELESSSRCSLSISSVYVDFVSTSFVVLCFCFEFIAKSLAFHLLDERFLLGKGFKCRSRTTAMA